jgi:hypothetical protein
MANFSNGSKSSQASFTKQTKDTDSWTNLQHSNIEGAGMDIQVMDSTTEYMDQAGNILITNWTTLTKENG